MIALKLNAGNDPNGNPRRVLLLIGKYGQKIAAVDEGYRGETGALEHAGFRAVPVVYQPLTVKVGEYRALLRDLPNKRAEVTP